MSRRSASAELTERPRPGRGFGAIRDFVDLMKPGVMSLVVFTAFVGMMVAPGTIDPVTATIAILMITLGAGASGALNMWYDADIDARMPRTCERPIPTGRVTPGQALAFGTILSIVSVVLLGALVNIPAAVLLAVTIAFYLFVYTMWLKRRTPQNIVIGGAAGAFPPMIGWTAVTGDISLASAILFAIIFFWTPPHFWSLALYKATEYEEVGVPMLPVVAGARETRKQILIYTVLMVPISIAPWPAGFAGPVYGVSAAILSGVFVGLAMGLWRAGEGAVEGPARKLFLFSLLYLFAIFAILLVDHFIAPLL